MKVKYLMFKPKGFEKNAEFAQQLMTTLEISGVFSEALLNKVFDILYITLDAVEKKTDKVPFEQYQEFNTILNTYCIFSEEFKTTCSVLFMSVITNYTK